MYGPIVGSDESYQGREPADTPKRTMERTIKLQVLYADLRNDLLEEVDMAESRIIKPAMQAKDGIQPLKKVIKKRGDRKVCSGQRWLPKLGIDILSLILKSTNPAWIPRERRQRGRTEIMRL
jgi:hypothetical protein